MQVLLFSFLFLFSFSVHPAQVRPLQEELLERGEREEMEEDAPPRVSCCSVLKKIAQCSVRCCIRSCRCCICLSCCCCSCTRCLQVIAGFACVGMSGVMLTAFASAFSGGSFRG